MAIEFNPGVTSSRPSSPALLIEALKGAKLDQSESKTPTYSAADFQARDAVVEQFRSANFRDTRPNLSVDNVMSVLKGKGNRSIAFAQDGKEATIYLGVKVGPSKGPDTTPERGPSASVSAQEWGQWAKAKLTFKDGQLLLESSDGRKAQLSGPVAVTSKDGVLSVTVNGKSIDQLLVRP